MSTSSQEIGRQLQALRWRKGISQKKLAESLGMKQGTISYIELGKHDVRLTTLKRIAEALDARVIFEITKVEDSRDEPLA